jgi:hypothetical protein
MSHGNYSPLAALAAGPIAKVGKVLILTLTHAQFDSLCLEIV